jgi:hypothetical protein
VAAAAEFFVNRAVLACGDDIMNTESPTLPPDIPGEGLKHDWAMLDRYQAFSTELLRVSLTGIGAVGFLVTALAGKDSLLKISGVPPASRWGMGITLFALGLSAASALGHRYVSSDSMACHISLLRMEMRHRSKEEIEIEKESRNRRFKQSGALLFLSSCLLGLGAVALTLSFITLLKAMAG